MDFTKIKTEWDFDPLLKEDFSQERERVKKAFLGFRDKWKGDERYLEDPAVLKEALDEQNVLLRDYMGCEGYYYHLREERDQDDVEIRSKAGQISDFINEINNEIMFFDLNLAKVSKDKQKEFLESDLLKTYNYYLKVLFENAKYHLKEGEEKIMSLKSIPSRSLWARMVSSLLSKETRKVLDNSGNMVDKTYPEMTVLMQSSDKEIRDVSAKAFNEIMDKYVEVAEFEINALLEDKKINDSLRGFSRPDEARHRSDLIETEVVDALRESVSNRGFKLSEKFYDLKAKILGLEKLKYYERNVELGSVRKEFSYEEAIQMVSRVFYKLDKKFGEIFDDYLTKGQIDVFPKKGKFGGAFCTHWSVKDPTYILLNYAGKVRDISTIAHEAGHGINNEFMKMKQIPFYYDTPKSTAEVASTFMEDFVFDDLLNEVEDEEKLGLLLQKLNEEVATIMRQIALYNFEIELHETYRKENYLSKEKIAEMFIKHMQRYMGDSVDCSEAGNWWVYWDHIREYFYVYSYASGLLISKSMQKMVRENPENIEKVKEFLSAGTSDSPKNTFLKMGIDITDKEFWEKGLDQVESLLNETEELAKKLGKI